MIPIQLILDIFRHIPKTEDACEDILIEMQEIIGRINDRKIKMSELREQNEKTNQEILAVSIEIDELLNKYYQMILK